MFLDFQDVKCVVPFNVFKLNFYLTFNNLKFIQYYICKNIGLFSLI